MDPSKVPTNSEAELESFRRQWREEVTARAKGKAPAAASQSHTATPVTKPTPASSSKTQAQKSSVPDTTHARQRSVEHTDDVTPYVYQDLGDKEHGRRLDETPAQQQAVQHASQEPTSALEHYEEAVEKEGQGRLGDSVNLYRKAFKLDHKVHEKYKEKHFPPSYFKKNPPVAGSREYIPPTTSTSAAPVPSTSTSKPTDPNPSNAPVTVPSTAHHSLDGLSSNFQHLLADFSSLSIQAEPPPTDLSPPLPCPIATIPEEILVEILEHLAIRDVASFARLAQVCKRLAYLVATEDRIWKRIALGEEYGFAAMHYDWTCQVDGSPLGDDDLGGRLLGPFDSDDESSSLSTMPKPTPLSLTPLLIPSPYPTYRTLFRSRPRIRFNGIYISTVNYTRAGGASQTATTWQTSIHIVTYYRYLRFLRDGTVISLLTTSEPADVVPYMYVEHMHKSHGALPSAPMKDALLGRWRLSGPEVPASSDATSTSTPHDTESETEKEGILHIETAGVTPKYLYALALRLESAGKRGGRNNKLGWIAYRSYNRLTDDWGDFGLKNDRPFYFSRVKRFGMGFGEGGMKV